jgi:hypothetical protein
MLGFVPPQIPCSLPASGRMVNSPGHAEGRLAVEMIAGCLQHARQVERLAAEQANLDLKARPEKRPVPYGKLATDRTKKLGLEPPLRGAG